MAASEDELAKKQVQEAVWAWAGVGESQKNAPASKTRSRLAETIIVFIDG